MADISGEPEVRTMIDRVVAELGGIDALINNQIAITPIRLDMTDHGFMDKLSLELNG